MRCLTVSGQWMRTGGAANHLSVGQIYLYDNPLLKHSPAKERIKPRLRRHCGMTPA